MMDVMAGLSPRGTAALAATLLVVGSACVDKPAEDPPAPPPRRPAAKLSPKAPSVPAPEPSTPAAEVTPPPPAPLPRDLHGKTVLHAGDSMVGGNGGLAKALGRYFTGEGARFVRDAEVAVSIRKYSQAPRFRRLLDHYKPDIVILTLGANDVFLPYPEYFGAYVESIVKTVGPRECYWVGPPTWKPDTGIVGVIRAHAGSCKFFDSSALDIARAKDRIHPNDEGGATWAEHFLAFFEGKPAPAPHRRGGTVRIGASASER
jgi:acyl-CoA thioesterase-1